MNLLKRAKGVFIIPSSSRARSWLVAQVEPAFSSRMTMGIGVIRPS